MWTNKPLVRTNKMTIDDLTIEVVRKNIKNMHLRMYPATGAIRITAPLRLGDETIRRFAFSKIDWIKQHQKKYSEQKKIPPREYKQHEEHYFRGEKYLLNVIETAGTPKVLLKNKKYIDLYIKPHTPVEKRQELMTAWYREQIKEYIPVLIAKWEKLLNVQVNEWQVKKMKSKWGSCNVMRKRIHINLELMKRPEHCLEFVIVHELVHLKERLHNKRFYAFMDRYLPDWKQYKLELKEPY